MSCFSLIFLSFCVYVGTSVEELQNKSVVTSIVQNEGFRAEAYPDPIHGWYKPTIGHGLTYITVDESINIVNNRVNTIRAKLTSYKPLFTELSTKQQDALIEMGFQMGVSGLLKFDKMWDALENNDYELAYVEALNSRWAMQTPSRARKVAAKLK